METAPLEKQNTPHTPRCYLTFPPGWMYIRHRWKAYRVAAKSVSWDLTDKQHIYYSVESATIPPSDKFGLQSECIFL